MIQRGRHPKDWLSGRIPNAVNQLNWSAFPFNTRLFIYFWYAVFSWAGPRLTSQLLYVAFHLDLGMTELSVWRVLPQRRSSY